MATQVEEFRALSVSDVAHDSGVAPSAVRFYEKHGLITSTRSPGNQRQFGPEAACRIRVAKVAQRVGLTVREIAAVLDGLPHDPTAEDWGKVAWTLIYEARARVAALAETLDGLGSDRKLCEIDVPEPRLTPKRVQVGPRGPNRAARVEDDG